MAQRAGAPGGVPPIGQPPVVPDMPLGAPVDPAMASAAGMQQGQMPQDFGTQQAAGLLQQYAPAAPAAGPVPIAEDPYAEQEQERAAEQARLEAEHGRFATLATQGARGVLDFVLAPAALLAAGTEGIGALTGWDGLRDFGRDYGQSATGTEAMATLFGSPVVSATQSLFGNNATDYAHASSSYERSIRDIHAQQEAWPMLSTVSHFAGAVGASLGVAGLAAGAAEGAAAVAPTLGQTLVKGAITGGIEGGEAGAQAAYDEHRPLRDVLGSTLMGGLLGAGTAAAFQSGAHYFESKAFDEGLENFALDRTYKAVGGIGSDTRKLGGVEQARRLANDVAGYTLADGEKVFPESVIRAGTMPLEEVAERIATGREELASKLGAIRSTVGEYLDKSAPELRPSANVIESRIRADVLNELESSNISGAKAGPILDVVKDIQNAADKDGSLSIDALRTVQERLKRVVYPKNPGGGLSALVSPAREEQQVVERILEDEMTKAADRGAKSMAEAGESGAELASQYTKVKKLTQSFIQADQIAKTAAMRRLGNRGASLTDTLAGTAALAGDLASGGGVGAAIKGLGVTALHKYAREHGSAFMAALANKLSGHAEEVGETAASISDKLGEANIGAEAEAVGADAHAAAESEERGLVGGTAGGNMLTWLWPKNDHQYVSVDAAGGREAQSVIANLARARARVNDAVEAAGQNPVQRQAAQANAMASVSAALATRAGPYDPTTWQIKAPNPMQKVLHRPEILNQVSSDLTQSAAQAAALKPSPDFDLNADRVKKLTKDADGPTAIGGVQQTVKQMIVNAPATPTGDQIRQVGRLALERLNEADVPEAMTTGHQTARAVSALADGASDQVTQAYSARQVTELQQALSDKSFGKAGDIYGKLTAAPSPAFQQLLDPNVMRDSLSNVQARGVLPDALKELLSSVLDAHDARKQLGGTDEGRPVAKQLKQVEQQFYKAQDAVTLDGGPAGRVLDFFRDKPGADASGLRGSPEMLVMNAVRPQMEKMLPVLARDRDSTRSQPTLSSLPPPRGQMQAQYSDRMQSLAAAVANPDPDAIAASMRGLPNVPPEIQTAVATDSQQRMQQLIADMPKPAPSVRGKAFETLSSDDLRKANAMWEATVKPMSVFSDFHAGMVDYDKAQYVWKQYPGLQKAAQAGMMDVLHAHLSDDERAALPDSMLTQIDFLLGFGGTLQSSVDRGFSARMTAMAAQQDQEKPQQNGPLELETSKPTFTERIAGAKG